MPRVGIPKLSALRCIAFAVSALVSSALFAEPPRVAVSIPPWHSLAAGVTAGISEVELLLPAGHSPHEGGLAPSTLRAVLNATLVAWTGPQLETGLTRALEQLDSERVLTIASLPGLEVLPLRHSGIHHGHDHGHGSHRPLDPHLWLSPTNARMFSIALAERLSRMDPENESGYRSNLEKLLRSIDQSEQDIGRDLSILGAAPFVVFHDAYQYFEATFGLSSTAAVTLGPDRSPGARKLRTLRQLIEDQQVRCVFTEPQFEPAVVRVLTEDLGVRVGMLDPLGAEIAAGSELWFLLMEGLRDSLLNCLGSDEGLN